ncbi:MAG: hypothetical protein PVI74_13415, partial [Syntrophobacterales bacterium]
DLSLMQVLMKKTVFVWSQFKTAVSVHPAFQGHIHQNFVRTHHRSSRIYPLSEISVPLSAHDTPDI